MPLIWGRREGEYFLDEDWTGGIGLIGLKKLGVWRNAWRGEKRRRSPMIAMGRQIRRPDDDAHNAIDRFYPPRGKPLS
jgi:hypothetical protein